MKTLELLKTHGPVYYTPKGCKYKIQWVKPGVTARPPNMKNLQALAEKGKIWAAYNRPEHFGFFTTDTIIGKSWFYSAKKPKVPSDALRENTIEMERIALRLDWQIDNLRQLKGESDIGNMFRDDCIRALKSNNDDGALELYNRMQANPLQDNTLDGLLKEWNEPRSPIRNFLLVRHIDYPEKTS